MLPSHCLDLTTNEMLPSHWLDLTTNQILPSHWLDITTNEILLSHWLDLTTNEMLLSHWLELTTNEMPPSGRGSGNFPVQVCLLQSQVNAIFCLYFILLRYNRSPAILPFEFRRIPYLDTLAFKASVGHTAPTIRSKIYMMRGPI